MVTLRAYCCLLHGDSSDIFHLVDLIRSNCEASHGVICAKWLVYLPIRYMLQVVCNHAQSSPHTIDNREFIRYQVCLPDQYIDYRLNCFEAQFSLRRVYQRTP